MRRAFIDHRDRVLPADRHADELSADRRSSSRRAARPRLPPARGRRARQAPRRCRSWCAPRRRCRALGMTCSTVMGRRGGLDGIGRFPHLGGGWAGSNRMSRSAIETSRGRRGRRGPPHRRARARRQGARPLLARRLPLRHGRAPRRRRSTSGRQEQAAPRSRFDYSGHGSSGGRFEDGTISRWLEEAEAVFDAFTDGPQIARRLLDGRLAGAASRQAARASAATATASPAWCCSPPPST